MGKSLIDDTLIKISEGYRPGLLMWLKRQPDRWRRLLDLEDGINKAALAGDKAGLKDTLSEYRVFFSAMLEVYGKRETLPLFGELLNGALGYISNLGLI